MSTTTSSTPNESHIKSKPEELSLKFGRNSYIFQQTLFFVIVSGTILGFTLINLYQETRDRFAEHSKQLDVSESLFISQKISTDLEMIIKIFIQQSENRLRVFQTSSNAEFSRNSLVLSSQLSRDILIPLRTFFPFIEKISLLDTNFVVRLSTDLESLGLRENNLSKDTTKINRWRIAENTLTGKNAFDNLVIEVPLGYTSQTDLTQTINNPSNRFFRIYIAIKDLETFLFQNYAQFLDIGQNIGLINPQGKILIQSHNQNSESQNQGQLTEVSSQTIQNFEEIEKKLRQDSSTSISMQNEQKIIFTNFINSNLMFFYTNRETSNSLIATDSVYSLFQTLTPAFILGLIILIFISRQKISNRLKEVTQTSFRLSNYDLRPVKSSLYYPGDDEIGLSISCLRDFLETLKNSLAELKKNSTEWLRISQETEESAKSPTTTMARIGNDLGQVHEKTENLFKIVSETSSIVSQLASGIERLEKSIENQASSVEESSSAVEEMIGNIQSITNITERARGNATDLKQASDEGRYYQNEMLQQIKLVADRSEQLIEANNLISSIASQTNLLSMNAAIEASHAGEAGKGFAVVAEEIRDLSDQVALQSESVAGVINEIRKTIDKSVEIATAAENSFDKTQDKVELVFQVMREISHTMNEQSEGSKEILIALTSMRTITHEVKKDSIEMSQGNSHILELSQNLTETSESIRTAVNSISEGINEFQELSSRIRTLARQSRLLGENVNLFNEKFTLPAEDTEVGIYIDFEKEDENTERTLDQLEY